MKLVVVDSFTKKEIKAWAEKSLDKDGCIAVTDGLNCFNGLDEAKYNHISRIAGPGKRSTDDICFKWVKTVIGNVKNAITGTYHASRNGYAPQYLAEFHYRFNRRFNLRALMPRLVRAAAATPPLLGVLLKLVAFHR